MSLTRPSPIMTSWSSDSIYLCSQWKCTWSWQVSHITPAQIPLRIFIISTVKAKVWKMTSTDFLFLMLPQCIWNTPPPYSRFFLILPHVRPLFKHHFLGGPFAYDPIFNCTNPPTFLMPIPAIFFYLIFLFFYFFFI